MLLAQPVELSAEGFAKLLKLFGRLSFRSLGCECSFVQSRVNRSLYVSRSCALWRSLQKLQLLLLLLL